MYDTATQNPPVATSDGAGIPAVGAKITAIRCRYHSTLDGSVGVVTQVIPGDPLGIICDLTKDGTTITGVAVSEWQPFTEPVLWPENATMEEMREIVRRLNNDLTEEKARSESRLQSLQRAEERLTEQQRRYSHDMSHWETTMRQAKDDQNWCDEGTNRVIRILNDGFIGGWNIDEYSEIVEAEVTIRGEVVKTITVHVKDGDDPDDPENWVDEDGDEVDADHIAETALAEEYRRNGWDEWEVQ